MKRTAVLLLVTFLLISGGFFVYTKLQPTTKAIDAKTRSVEVPGAKPAGEHIGPGIQEGQGVWLREFDPITGEQTRTFRAIEYVPQKNGTVLVKKPEVWFFGSNKQQVQITGTDGEVVVKDAPDLTSKSKDNSPPAPPNRGRLNHVTMKMYSATSAPGEPDEVLTADNIQFDNDTLLITTESFTDAAGNLVLPDQVPVQVRGKYDFDGRGLKMRWNDKDGRLEMLEITNGEQLVIKDASMISGLSAPNGPTTRRTSATRPTAQAAPTTQAVSSLPELRPSVRSVEPEREQAGLLGSVQQSPKSASATSPKKPITRPQRQPRQRTAAATGPTPYLATFNDKVQITQGDDVVATADRMEVDFLSKQENPRPTTGPATAAATHESGPVSLPAAPDTATIPSTSIALTAPTTNPSNTTQPATKPASPPVVVKWTGKLTIVPAPPDRNAALNGGSAIVSLIGSPVKILRQMPEQKKRQEIRAAVAVYHTEDRSMFLKSSPDSPLVELKEFLEGRPDPVSTVTTASLDYLAGQHLAVLGANGHVVVPADETDPKKGNLDARWSRSARLYLLGGGAGETGELSVRQMDLAGDVDVQHPQLSMQSQALSLFFDPGDRAATQPSGRRARSPSGATTLPATQPTRPQLQLQRMLANTDVHCQLTDAEGKHQTIDGQQLEMLTARGADGQIHPRRVNAEGKVHAFDGEQDLRSRRLEIALRPATSSAQTQPARRRRDTTQPSTTRPASADIELESMHAAGDVITSSKDGAIATGDDLQITMIDGEPHVRLTSADGKAKVIDARHNVMTGPLITAQTKKQLAHIDGPGSVEATMADQDGSKPRKVTVAWRDQADVNGPRNAIDAVGQVVSRTIEEDGAVVVSAGDRVHVDLEEKPAPATKPAATTAPTTAPTTRRGRGGIADATSANPMGQKQVKAVTLDGNASVVSTLADAQDRLLLQRAIEGPKIIYQASQPLAAASPSGTSRQQQSTASVLVPAAGRMLLRDYRDPEKRSPSDSGSGMDSGRGDTAFRWSDHFLYSEAQRRAVMVGDVLIAYKGVGAKEQQVNIEAPTVLADFEPAKAKPTTRPAATAPTTRPQEDRASLQIRTVLAQGTAADPARVTRGGSMLAALQIRFDPQTHLITASGTAAHPAVFMPGDGGPSTHAEQLQWNSITWNVRIVGATVQGRGR